jgi:DnaJ-class molecular chaperone
MQQTQGQCSSCHGTGNQIDPKNRCKKCSGRKVFRQNKIFDVNISHGSQNGEIIKFLGEGNQTVTSNLFYFDLLLIYFV